MLLKLLELDVPLFLHLTDTVIASHLLRRINGIESIVPSILFASSPDYTAVYKWLQVALTFKC